MRKFFIGLIVLALIVAGGLAAVAYLIPSSVYKERIEVAASEALGRDVVISGPVSVSLLPQISARAESVTIANANGFSEEFFAEAAELRAVLALVPLLSRNVEVKEFILGEPSITLEVLPDGSNNWTFAEGGEAGSGGSDGFVRRPGALPFEAALGEVRIERGAVRYLDRATGLEQHFEQVDLSLAMPSLDEALRLNADLQFNNEPVRVSATLDSLRSFFDGAEAPFALEIESNLVTAGANGRFAASEALDYSGDISVEIVSLRDLAAAVGTSLPPGDEIFEAFSISGEASGGAQSLAFRDARLRFDDISGRGDFGADFSGSRPDISGDLTLAELNVNPYLRAQSRQEDGAGSGGVPPWSEEEVDVSFLNLLDAELTLVAETLRYGLFRFTGTTLQVSLQNGEFVTDLVRLNAYGGTGTARVTANTRSAQPTYALTANLESVEALPLLEAAGQFSRLSGVGDVSIDVRTTGSTVAEIMGGLTGTGGFQLQDGAISGINLGGVARGVSQALSGDLAAASRAIGAQESTDFSELTSSFAITRGVARTEDLQMLSPLLRVVGAGALDIGGQSVDFTLEPRVVASAQGQGGVRDLGGVVVPVHIEGDWNNVSARPDLAAATTTGSSSDLGSEAAGLIEDNVGGDVGRAINSLLGITPPPAEEEDSAVDDADAAAADAPATEDEEQEEEEDLLDRALGEIFGGG